jgi:porin
MDVGLGVYEVNPDNVKTQSNSDGFNLDMNNVKGATILWN